MKSTHDDDGSDDSEATIKKKVEEAVQKVPITQLFRYSSTFERFLLFLACVVSIGTGTGLPLMSILQGNVAQAFIDEERYLQYGDTTNHTIDGSPYNEKHHFEDRVYKVVYGYAGLCVGIFCAAFIQVSSLLWVCENMSHRLRRRFVQAILRQEIAYFDRHASGSLATTLFDNLERVKEGTGDKLGLMIQLLSQFVTGFVVAFAHNWKLTLIMVAVTPLQAACGFAIVKVMSQYSAIEAQKYAKAGAVAEEVLSSIRTVAAFNGLEREADRYQSGLLEAKKAGVMKALLAGLAFGAIFLVNFSGFALSFYIGVGWVHSGAILPQDMLTVFFSVTMGSMALGQAGPQFAVLGSAQGAAFPIFEVLDTVPQIDSQGKDGVKDVKIDGKLSFRNIRFSYPSRQDIEILKGISFEVNAGETIALVGSSGSGKSTIISLLLRFYDVNSGEITIDGHRIDSLNINFLRNTIGVVSQEPVLFNGTIEENLRLGRLDVTEAEMWKVLALANADTFIRQLPRGLKTMVGERGTQLSGGQKQRIAIARALVRDPRILLLDEATSALDAEAESHVQRALDHAVKGRTTVIVAHRLSTIRGAHKIIVMQHGEIKEVGTHDELIARRSFYYELVNAQLFTDAVDDSATAPEPSPAPVRKLQTQTSKISSRLSKRTSIVSEIDVDLRARASTVASIPTIFAEEEDMNKLTEMQRLQRELKEAGVEKTSLAQIVMFAREQWHLLFGAFFFALLSSTVFPAYSIFFTQILDVFTLPPDQELKKGHFWALMFLVLGAVNGVSLFSFTLMFGTAAESLAVKMRNALFRNIISNDMSFFDSPKNSSGKISTRLATDVPNVKAAIDFRLGSVTQALLSILIGIGVAFYFGWQMAFVVLALIPIVVVGQALRSRFMQGAHRKNSKETEEAGRIAMEAIENVRTVQSLTREVTFYERFCEHMASPHRQAAREALIQGAAYGLATSSVFILSCCSYRFGMWLILRRTMMPIHVLRVMYAITMSATTLGFASAYVPEYLKARFAGGIIFDMLAKRPKINSLSRSGERPQLTGRISFLNVQFAYPERPHIQVLKGLSFELPAGKTLALVGPSGCGKSTVVQLLERFYDPAGGSILLDGHDLRSLDIWHIRDSIALVSQEPTLFDRSIAANIVYGLDGVTPEDIQRAARLANIHDFIVSLPEGYDTRVGERGTQLSGGQKQRIAIARALVRNPRILLLDEATSALDTESERVVQEALDRARAGRTSIVIAHRLSTIINADSIAVIQAGQVVEQGTHQELLSKRGLYAALVDKQQMHAQRTG